MKIPPLMNECEATEKETYGLSLNLLKFTSARNIRPTTLLACIGSPLENLEKKSELLRSQDYVCPEGARIQLKTARIPHPSALVAYQLALVVGCRPRADYKILIGHSPFWIKPWTVDEPWSPQCHRLSIDCHAPQTTANKTGSLGEIRAGGLVLNKGGKGILKDKWN